MLSTELVDLSRLQFAATAMYHYLFVPLTLGLDDFGSNGSLLPKDRETSLQRHGEILGQVIWY